MAKIRRNKSRWPKIQPQQIKICPHCGTRNHPKFFFCKDCGRNMGKDKMLLFN